MDNLSAFKEAVIIEKTISQIIDEMVTQIAAEIEESPLDSVKILSKNVVSVNLSDLCVWSPDYYMQSRQAEVVKDALSRCQNANRVLERVNQMIEDGFVEIRSCRHRVTLNKKTIGVLLKFQKQMNN